MVLGQTDSRQQRSAGDAAAGDGAFYPQIFDDLTARSPDDSYLSDPLIQDLLSFFRQKGLPALKEEDQRAQWYDDWLAYQGQRRLYARLLCPTPYSNIGSSFDLARFARFLEIFAYCSPAHGYSLQVSFLGLFAILMGANEALKHSAVAALEAGRLLAFGISEKQHGADLLGNEFRVCPAGPGRFIARGTKYYIGNANAAALISILARQDDARHSGSARRTPFILFTLRPDRPLGLSHLRKIATLGVRAAYVGEFEVQDYELSEADVIATGRQAWDAVAGTVTLGKFFLGFGSIGICEHAFAEAATHLRERRLYGRPASEMPHLRALLAQAYARVTAMKFYAYRALDYVRAATAEDRRYLLYCAVQKARVSTEGVKVISLLSECIGARGFESETYFEMALRDAPLIPGLEGSTHINLKLTAQFMPRYLESPNASRADPPVIPTGGGLPGENLYLLKARMGAIQTVRFPHFLRAFNPLLSISNVRIFVTQAKAFQLATRNLDLDRSTFADSPANQALGQVLAIIAYAQLVSENAHLLHAPGALIAVMFHTLVQDFSAAALALAACDNQLLKPALIRRMLAIPNTRPSDWDFVAACFVPTPPADRQTE